MLEILKLRDNLIESSCLIFTNCFLPCMWPQVIDLFSSKQAGIAGMAVSFSIARGIAWSEGRSLAWSLPIIFFHTWLLFPSMHVASGDRFVSFKAGGDRRDDNFFFCRAGYRMTGRKERPKTKVAQKINLTFSLFNYRRYAPFDVEIHNSLPLQVPDARY